MVTGNTSDTNDVDEWETASEGSFSSETIKNSSKPLSDANKRKDFSEISTSSHLKNDVKTSKSSSTVTRGNPSSCHVAEATINHRHHDNDDTEGGRCA